jgi:hypothetical protein
VVLSPIQVQYIKQYTSVYTTAKLRALSLITIKLMMQLNKKATARHAQLHAACIVLVKVAVDKLAKVSEVYRLITR